MASKRVSNRLNLIIDADDTLWENNIYFEMAFEQFCSFLSHSRLSPLEVRAVLDEIELANSKIHGYGSANFGKNLKTCYRHLSERDIGADDLITVMSFAERILDHPMQVIPGVEDTLQYLSGRHSVTLFTKGDHDEQKLKLDRSRLATYFEHTAIVKEKDAAAYALLVTERGFNAECTWMIGNSPKSDVNPALRAGLNAVFIPHAHTWTLEHEEVDSSHGERLVVLERFEELKGRF